MSQHDRENDAKFWRFVAKRYLKHFGNPGPTLRQFEDMIDLVSKVWLRRDLLFSHKLTDREKECLYYAAYASVNGHYRYRRPDTGKWYSVGDDRKAAIHAATQLNSQLRTKVDIVEKVLNGTASKFKDFLKQFEERILPSRELSQSSLEYYKLSFSRFYQHFGDKLTDEITVQDIASFLDSLRPETANKHRGVLSIVFKYAVAKGLCHDNLVSKTLPYPRKKLRRLTLEGYLVIYHHPDAKPWFKNAMDLALQMLQRHGDIINMKFSDVRDGYLYVVQQKTEKYSTTVPLKIKIGPILHAVLDRCRDELDSSYLVHRQPNKDYLTSCHTRNKQHPTQLNPDYVSMSFSAP